MSQKTKARLLFYGDLVFFAIFTLVLLSTGLQVNLCRPQPSRQRFAASVEKHPH